MDLTTRIDEVLRAKGPGNYITNAGLTALVWDFILTFPDEVRAHRRHLMARC